MSNRSTVLAALLSGHEMDRQQLIRDTGLSRATVFRIVDDLMSGQLVLERRRILREGPGRNSTAVGFNGRSAVVCGVDLGGTHCRVLVSDALGRPLIRSRDATPRQLPAEALARWVAERISGLVRDHGAGIPLHAVTIGLPGAVAGDSKTVVGSHNLEQIQGTAFIAEVSRLLRVPTIIANDSNLALLGERQYGSLPESETAVLLSMGTGLGVAISINGQILTGAGGLLGEFGRLRLPGRTHRLRDLISGAGLAAYARDRGIDVASTSSLFADREKYGALLHEVDEAITHLVSIVALAYEPRTVVLTGGFSDSFTGAALHRISDEVAATVGVRTVIKKSALGDSAGLLGAMASSLSRLYTALGVSPDHLASIDVDREQILGQLESCAIDEPKERKE
ncbi:ROK family protein [Saccharopolyspora sp. K220]|uniref:ROK family protein n=1 Tax=Saccharopolyspora soli TaxID=2926618 RepID=UPI001F579972|nr:ROK family protein [Saccharopolyspora soli]MCI2417004.1 ROK family protein [Saccharopolyspora soli]